MFNKALFDNYLLAYKIHLLKNGLRSLHIWKSQLIFNEKWDLKAYDLLSNYLDSVDENTETWTLPLIQAKATMKIFIEINEDLTRTMFKDLFNDEKDLEGRIGRFLFHCDLLLSKCKKSHPKLIDHHHNKDIIIRYLTYRFPESYCLFSHAAFYKSMTKMGSRNAPELHELDRYFKIMRILKKFILADVEVNEFMLSQSKEMLLPTSLLIAHDFIKYVNEASE